MDDDVHPSPGRSIIHTVAQGDTYESIAQRYYGAAHEWPRLFRHNRNVGILTPGDQLVIPR